MIVVVELRHLGDHVRVLVHIMRRLNEVDVVVDRNYEIALP